MLLIDQLLPAVADILDEQIVHYPATISEIFEQLETTEYWKELDYYILENLIYYVYSDKVITESKVEVLFEND